MNGSQAKKLRARANECLRAKGLTLSGPGWRALKRDYTRSAVKGDAYDVESALSRISSRSIAKDKARKKREREERKRQQDASPKREISIDEKLQNTGDPAEKGWW